MKILFVDDDPRALRLLQRDFKDTNYTCLFASSGKEALELLPVDVLVTDMNMPEMSGAELLRAVPSNVIRITLSSEFNIDGVNNSYYVLKPYCAKELKLLIYNQLRERNTPSQDERELRKSVSVLIKGISRKRDRGPVELADRVAQVLGLSARERVQIELALSMNKTFGGFMKLSSRAKDVVRGVTSFKNGGYDISSDIFDAISSLDQKTHDSP